MARGLSKWPIRLLTVGDQGGRRLFAPIATRGNRTIEIALAPLVPSDAVLCSDGLKPYRAFCKKNGSAHYEVSNKPGKRVVAGAFHIQNVNARHARDDAFVRPFCGPTTKYLYRTSGGSLLRKKITPDAAFKNIVAASRSGAWAFPLRYRDTSFNFNGLGVISRSGWYVPRGSVFSGPIWILRSQKK
ncbi:hypothetical protein GCM10011363_34250 [Marivita lacus]|uniref:IS1595 family transposase n=1 Tax=Marivita lacus TaxID=1323742 RepID=A0ABQ1L1F3_9RHOB|nr:hypothetical protein [Marivita lacus]GGC14857.1 hypothetical protein GCM10011363_34250 [Marivita lacus]